MKSNQTSPMPKLNKKRREQIVLEQLEGGPTKVWDCKIGFAFNGELGEADDTMRKAVEKAFRKLTGRKPDFIFSGWGGELTQAEMDVVREFNGKS